VTSGKRQTGIGGELLQDVLAVGGSVSIVYGCWLLQPSCGYIVAGLLALAGALCGWKNRAGTRNGWPG
jgi:hypothetical protein